MSKRRVQKPVVFDIQFVLTVFGVGIITDRGLHRVFPLLHPGSFLEVVIETMMTTAVVFVWMRRRQHWAREMQRRMVEDQNHYQRALRNLEEMYTSFMDNTSDALLLFRADRTVLHVNRAFEEVYGWKLAEVVGKPLPPLAPPELLPEIEEMINEILSGEVVSSRETIRLRKDGTALDVNVTVVPIRDADGNIDAIAGLSRDITHYKKMTRDLMETRHLFESLILHTADAICMMDLSGKLQMVNAAWEKLYGWPASEVIGQMSPAVTEWDEAMLSRYIDNMSRGQVFTREVWRRRRDGTQIEVSLTESPIFSSKGELVAVAVIAKDLTELRQTEELMLRSAKLTLAGELAAGIAHEIRNPLTAIQGFLQLMRRGFDPKYLDVLLPEVKRINDITDELLLLSKPQVGEGEPSDITAIIREVVTLMESEAHLHSISIHTHFEAGISPIVCVRNQIKQVFINLVKNSIEAIGNGGVICVRVRQLQGRITVSVEDDGPGIPQEKISRLGEPFYTTKERGTGLGLMVTYRIIQQHQGSIKVTSEPGRGSEFEITLPRSPQNALDEYSRALEQTNEVLPLPFA